MLGKRKRRINGNTSAKDLDRIKKSFPFAKGEEFPTPGFTPRSPADYGRSCAYDMAYRLLYSYTRIPEYYGDGLVVNNFWYHLYYVEYYTHSSFTYNYLASLIETLGRKYKDFINHCVHDIEMGWLLPPDPCMVWRNCDVLNPAVKTLCAYMAYRGIPFLSYDDSGNIKGIVSPDFTSGTGIWKTEEDAKAAAKSFFDSCKSLKGEYFHTAHAFENMAPDHIRLRLYTTGWDDLILPEFLVGSSSVNDPASYIRRIEASLEMKHRVFGDEVPTDILPIQSILLSPCSDLPDNVSEEQLALIDLILGSNPDCPCNQDIGVEGENDTASESSVVRYNHIREEADLTDFNVRNWIEDKFRKQVDDKWHDNEYKKGRLRCLSGLRLAASKISDDKYLIYLLMCVCNACGTIGKALFTPCMECSCFMADDCFCSDWVVLSLIREEGADMSRLTPGEWNSAAGNASFICDVNNLMMVLCNHGVLNTVSEEISYERFEGWFSIIHELNDVIFDDDGNPRSIFKDIQTVPYHLNWSDLFCRSLENQ